MDKLAYRQHNPVPGDIIIFWNKQDNIPFVKRLVAVAGQRVDATDTGKLLVDGKEVSYNEIPYEIEAGFTSQKFVFDSIIVPDNSYFVVGDNFSRSFDSRFFGPIEQDQLIGKVIRVFDY